MSLEMYLDKVVTWIDDSGWSHVISCARRCWSFLLLRSCRPWRCLFLIACFLRRRRCRILRRFWSFRFRDSRAGLFYPIQARCCPAKSKTKRRATIKCNETYQSLFRYWLCCILVWIVLGNVRVTSRRGCHVLNGILSEKKKKKYRIPLGERLQSKEIFAAFYCNHKSRDMRLTSYDNLFLWCIVMNFILSFTSYSVGWKSRKHCGGVM